METETKKDVYTIITDRIIERIEKEGCLPWRKPWSSGGFRLPKNLTTNKGYRGVNVWVLYAMGYESPYWITYKQAKELGGTVKRGEHGTPVLFWSTFDKTKDDKTETVAYAKYYTVFNSEQCEGLEVPEIKRPKPNDIGSIECADNVVKNMPHCPEIKHGESRAYYTPAFDTINMPKKEMFKSAPGYYETLFHELTHSTGHTSRLGRIKLDDNWHKFGSNPYAKEELIAELGSAYLCGHTNILAETEENNAAYIKGWLTQLRGDRKLIVQASAQAQKAVDYILGTKPENS